VAGHPTGSVTSGACGAADHRGARFVAAWSFLAQPNARCPGKSSKCGITDAVPAVLEVPSQTPQEAGICVGRY